MSVCLLRVLELFDASRTGMTRTFEHRLDALLLLRSGVAVIGVYFSRRWEQNIGSLLLRQHIPLASLLRPLEPSLGELLSVGHTGQAAVSCADACVESHLLGGEESKF